MLAERVLTKFLKGVTKKYLSLEHIGVSTLPEPRDGASYYLYAHVPFCHVLCPYCSFNRFIFQEDKALSYYRQLRSEMRLVADMGYQFRSMYIGGGTPTICVDELLKTIDLAHDLFEIHEVSCETNPTCLTPEFARRFRGEVPERTNFSMVGDSPFGPFHIHGTGQIVSHPPDAYFYAAQLVQLHGRWYLLATIHDAVSERISDPVPVRADEAGIHACT